jgi:predicted RNase H-like HicB family nuclease
MTVGMAMRHTRHFPVGVPGWRLWARFGLPVGVQVMVVKDSEAGVFTAHAPRLRGLHVEAETLEELMAEIQSAVDELVELEAQPKRAPETQVSFTISDAATCAA